MEREVDVWNPDGAQLFRAASPATPRRDVAALLSPSPLSYSLSESISGGDPRPGSTKGSLCPALGSYSEESSPTMGVGPERVRTEAKT